jgi:DNA-binding CsgD family transcriptional regulator
MLPASYASILQCRGRDDFKAELIRLARQLGFDTVTAMTVIERGPADYEFVVVDNAPAGVRAAFDSIESQHRDPVMQHCKTQSVPIIWTQDTYVDQHVGELWEAQAAFGYRAGMAMALHLPERHHFVLGVDRDGDMPEDRAERQRLLSDLQLFTVYAVDAAMRVLVPKPLQPESPGLTRREVEVLRWTMEGKTAWEVGRILSISERTAVLHIGNAMRKLGCINKHQAVLKALRLGLIH